LLEYHPHLVGLEFERVGDIVSDLARERLAEVPFVAVTG
jgi:hypothetical protein